MIFCPDLPLFVNKVKQGVVNEVVILLVSIACAQLVGRFPAEINSLKLDTDSLRRSCWMPVGTLCEG